jgi:hypothetical protein
MIDAPYAAAFRSYEDSMLAADARAERAHDLWGALIYGADWESHDHVRDWTIEDVHDELAGSELALLRALYWIGSQDEKRKIEAMMYLGALSRRMQDRLDTRIDEQLDLDDEAARERWEMRNVE